MVKPTHHYIGRCPRCKAVTASVYDMTDNQRVTAECVADMIRGGLITERVPLGSVEFSPDGCVCRVDPTAAQVATLPLFTEQEQPQ